MRKKFTKIIILLIILLIISVLVYIAFLFLYREYKIIKWPDYYKDLARKCPFNIPVLRRQNCCIESIATMVKDNYKVVPVNGCPEGHEGICAICPDSYCFCVPKEKMKDLLNFPVFQK